jgi:hypothetical protein
MSRENIKDAVKEKYGQAALRVIQGRSSCCGTAPARLVPYLEREFECHPA